MIEAIQKNMTWRAIPIAGFVGGCVFLLTSIILSPIVLDVSATLLLRYIAALVLGSDTLTDTGTGVLLLGVIVHLFFSTMFAFVIAVVIHRWSLGVGILGGAILGLCLYSFNIYTLTKYAEWFFAINSNILLLCHVIYGAVVGGVYESLDRFDLPLLPKEKAHE